MAQIIYNTLYIQFQRNRSYLFDSVNPIYMEDRSIFLFIFCYNSMCALARFTIFLHSLLLSSIPILQFLTCIFLRSFSTCSFGFDFGSFLGVVSAGFHSVNILVCLSSSFRNICPYHLILYDLYISTMLPFFKYSLFRNSLMATFFPHSPSWVCLVF